MPFNCILIHCNIEVVLFLNHSTLYKLFSFAVLHLCLSSAIIPSDQTGCVVSWTIIHLSLCMSCSTTLKGTLKNTRGTKAGLKCKKSFLKFFLISAHSYPVCLFVRCGCIIRTIEPYPFCTKVIEKTFTEQGRAEWGNHLPDPIYKRRTSEENSVIKHFSKCLHLFK